MKKAFTALYRYWMKFAHVLGAVNGFIILTFLFYTIVGAYALVRKVIVLVRQMPNEESFWQPKKVRPATLEELRRQF